MPLATRRDIGQYLIGSMPGTSVPVELRSLAREFDLGGVILFSRNIEAPEQVAELAAESEALGRTTPAWVSVDQEGGRVARLKEPFTKWPPMATLGRAGKASEALAERFAKALADELLAVGITLDYAPVLDIHTNPKNPVIGDRALAERAEDVAKLGRVIIRALQGAGLAACGKHFPGHGDTSTDSHFELPLVEHPPDRLRAIEFEPFRAAIAEQVAFIMTAHVLVPSLDETRPATLSPDIVQKLLARRAGVRRRDPERRPRDEGGQREVRRAGGGRRCHSRRLRRRADLQRRHRSAGPHARSAGARRRVRAHSRDAA